MARTSTTSGVEVLVTLRREDPTPLHAQVERELREAVRQGRLQPEAALPSSRLMAAQLGVSRGVVVEAYAQLVAEGYLASHQGSATRVACEAAPPTLPAPRPIEAPRINFHPGRPDTSQFPRAAWLRTLRRVINEAPSDRFGYSEGRGLVELRVALAAYLNRVRGTVADADRMVIANGFTQAIGLVWAALRALGVRRVALEDPSHSGPREALEREGLEAVGVPVDEDGLRVDLLERTDAQAVLVTPAHQYPTGAVLPPERRGALVEWATRRGGVIIEDDYDAEYRYDREPIGAIQGLAPDRVVYAGSASKTLAPGLRLGWLALPPALVDAVGEAKLASDGGSPAFEQLAFADYITHGELDRHLRRMRPIYRRRRDALLVALARHLPQLRPVGTAAGLHLLAWLPPELDEATIVARAAEQGIAIYGIERYRLAPGGPGGLVFGYSSLSEQAIDRAVRLLADGHRLTRDSTAAFHLRHDALREVVPDSGRKADLANDRRHEDPGAIP